MHILITGGAGFIGSHLADHLLSQGHDITIIDNLYSGKIENVSKKARLIIGDINDLSLLKKAFDGVEVCYHLAAITSIQKSVDNWIECNKVNLTGTINVFMQAAQHKIPVIYASSAAVYGNSTELPLSEAYIGKIISPYGVDKYSCELQANVFSHVYGLRTTGLRFFNVYGTRQDANSPYSGVISIFSENIKKGKALNIYGDGSQERDFIFIDDVVNALVLAKDNMSNDSQIYNVCTGYGVQINNLLQNLFKVFDQEVGINYLDWREGEIYKSIGNPQKAKNNIGFIASTQLFEGLKILSNKKVT